MSYQHDNRPERELDWLSNPTAPLTGDALDQISQEASRILTETLNQLETGRSVTP